MNSTGQLVDVFNARWTTLLIFGPLHIEVAELIARSANIGLRNGPIFEPTALLKSITDTIFDFADLQIVIP
jgi:hypothetical protein